MPGFELIGQEELASITEIFEKSGGVMFAHGFDARRNNIFRVRQFEKDLAKRFQASHCQCVSSGTAAGFVALKALGIKPGDEVITQAFTFVATIEDIIECGATPIVVDIDKTLNMDPLALEKAITEKTKAIMPVHMLGNPARMDEILKIASKHKIPVVEDACEALGATYRGRQIGTLGTIGCFSMDFGKTITTGEGGFNLTNDESLFLKMRSYTDHGHAFLPNVARGLDTAIASGFNFRMTELQAAVGLAQLKKLDYILAQNRKNKSVLKNTLKSHLSQVIEFREITDPEGELADTTMFFFPHAEAANRVVQALAKNGIGTKNVPDAMNWHFAGRWNQMWDGHPRYDKKFDPWKLSRELLERCVSLPIMVQTSTDEMQIFANKVVRIIKETL